MAHRRARAASMVKRMGAAFAQALLGGLLLLGIGACESTAGPGYDTAVELSADRTRAGVDEQITFRYDAQGRHLQGIVIAYGDGQADSILTYSAQTAGGNRVHRYQEPGTFAVRAEAIDASGERASAELEVVISQESGG